MTRALTSGGVLLTWDEADLIERALVVAAHHRRPAAETRPSTGSCTALFKELRRVRAEELTPPSEPPQPSADEIRLRRGRVDRVVMSESAWSTARSALLLACFDDTLCEHDFQAVVGWPRNDFHALAAECEAIDAETLRAELFHARAVEDGVRHRKLLTFALDHLGMELSHKDAETLTRSLSTSAGTCDTEALTDLLTRNHIKRLQARQHHRTDPPARPETRY